MSCPLGSQQPKVIDHILGPLKLETKEGNDFGSCRSVDFMFFVASDFFVCVYGVPRRHLKKNFRRAFVGGVPVGSVRPSRPNGAFSEARPRWLGQPRGPGIWKRISFWPPRESKSPRIYRGNQNHSLVFWREMDFGHLRYGRLFLGGTPKSCWVGFLWEPPIETAQQVP